MTDSVARQRAIILLGLALAWPSGPSAQTGAAQAPGTGVVVGQVVDGTTGQAMPGATVRIFGSQPSGEPAPNQPGRVMTDEDGRFFFADLQAGEYYLSASLDGYIAGAYGQRRADGRGGTLVLRDSERRTDVTLRVWKYAVIGGTVVDEAGEPVVGIAVRALVRRIVAGRPQFGSQSYLVPTGTTDDRGVFRLARVPPGSYAVVVPSMHTSVPISVMNSWSSSTMRTELFWAGMYEVSPVGHPRTQQMGDHVLMTLNTVLIPPPPGTDGRVTMYRTTFYPSATTAPAATAVTVGAGEERTDLAITLRPSPAVRVSGRLMTPDGSAPPPTGIKLIGEAASDVVMASLPSGTAEVGLESVIGISDGSGRFTLLGVAPGEYTLIHADRFLSRLEQQGRQPYWVGQRITVGAADLRDVVVNLRPALRVEGRIERRGSAQPVPVSSLVFYRPFGEPDQFAVLARGDSFATLAAGGRYIAHASESEGWFVESITLDGKDITDRPFDLDSDATSFVVTYTDRASRVSGTVKDARGDASATAIVIAFPTDPQRWIGYGNSPRVPKAVVASPDGAYTIDHLPRGDYYLVAIDEEHADVWEDPTVLQTLASRAERITVAAGDPARTVDLTVRPVR